MQFDTKESRESGAFDHGNSFHGGEFDNKIKNVKCLQVCLGSALLELART